MLGRLKSTDGRRLCILHNYEDDVSDNKCYVNDNIKHVFDKIEEINKI